MRKTRVGLVYFIIMTLSILLRISSSEGLYQYIGLSSDLFFTLAIQLLIFGFIGFILYITIVQKKKTYWFIDTAYDTGFRSISLKNLGRVIILMISMRILTNLVSMIWSSVLSMIGFTFSSSSTDYSSVKVLITELILTALLPGIFEEVSHRGLLYSGYKNGKWKFVLISALLFSLMHANIVQSGYAFLGGAMMALVMYYTGSIIPSIMMHIFNNTCAVVIGYIGQNGGPLSFIYEAKQWMFTSGWGCMVLVVISILCLGLSILMYYGMRKDALKNNIINLEKNEKIFDKKSIFLVLSIVMGLAATIFSFVWGMIR